METQVKKETGENSQMKEQHKLQAKTTVNQVIGILNLVISIVILICVLFTTIRVSMFIDKAQPAIEVIAELDAENINKALTNLNRITDAVNFDEWMGTMEGLGDLMKNIDTEKLNDTLKDMKDASDAISTVKKKLEGVLKFFGG